MSRGRRFGRQRFAWREVDERLVDQQVHVIVGRGAYDGQQLRLRLTFNAAYSGNLHLYTADWDSTGRRQTISVNDGSTTQTVPLTTPYNAGIWLHFPISVPAGGSVVIKADYVAGYSATIAGLFLGGAGVPAPTPTPTPTPGPPTPTPPPPPPEPVLAPESTRPSEETDTLATIIPFRPRAALRSRAMGAGAGK